jgi:hypothetical protein
MFKRTIVGVDGGQSGREALALAALLQRTVGVERRDRLTRQVAVGKPWDVLACPVLVHPRWPTTPDDATESGSRAAAHAL